MSSEVSINTKAIEKKIQSFINSSKGASLMSKNIDKNKGSLGGYMGHIYSISNAFIEILKDTASSYNMPSSVMRHFNSLKIGDIQKVPSIKKSELCIMVDIFFDDDLERESLLKPKGGRTGEGIDNIIALFDTGYTASRSVFGIWDGHGSKAIRSLTHRDGYGFIKQAIDTFNYEYGDSHDVTAFIPTTSDFYK